MYYSINTSMAGILLAMCIVCMFSYCHRKPNHFVKLFIGFVIAALFGVLVYWKNRAGILGALAGVGYVLLVRMPNRRKFLNAHKWKTIGVLIAVCVSFTFLFKADSTSGRLFIYKICFRLLQKHWFAGVGHGNFNVAFNHEQAQYFSTASLNTKEAWLANDGYFAFNDWLQFCIEYGIVGCLLSLLCIFFFVRLLLALLKPTHRSFHSIAIVIPLIVASFVSYPFHNFFTTIIAVSLFYFILIALKSNKHVHLLLHIFFISFIITQLFFGGWHFLKQNQLSAAKELWGDGEKTVAVEKVAQLYQASKKDGAVAVVFASYLYFIGKTKEAIKVLEENDKWNCNQVNHAKLGNWYKEKGDVLKAEQHLRTSLQLTPHLLESRYNLMNFYIEIGKNAEAFYWANALVEYPIKIENKRAYIFKDSAKRVL